MLRTSRRAPIGRRGLPYIRSRHAEPCPCRTRRPVTLLRNHSADALGYPQREAPPSWLDGLRSSPAKPTRRAMRPCSTSPRIVPFTDEGVRLLRAGLDRLRPAAESARRSGKRWLWRSRLRARLGPDRDQRAKRRRLDAWSHGPISACATVTDSGTLSMNVCQNLADGIALQWTRVFPVSTLCADRTDACADAGLPVPDLGVLLDRCLGGESWIRVSMADGCATSFTISYPDPTCVACVTDALSSARYSCISGPVCAGALLSTLH